ncbi:hypothetical protein D6B98_29990 [Bradyrhizobium sp. LVM 105]|nr:hypothetical protein D6B98_29990 [Bradyrhizobium sp. LVM 105]
MGELRSEESQTQQLATWPRWKRWLADAGVLDSRVLLMSDTERQRTKTENLRRLAARPLWEKCIAIAGLATGAISVAAYPYLFGHLTIGWGKLGFTRTIVLSEEPALFIATLLLFESFFVCLFYFLYKVYFFQGSDGRPRS